MSKIGAMDEPDHIDRFLDSIAGVLPELDPAVEGIVDRTMGISRRFKRMMEETLAEHDLTYGEYQVLGALRQAGEPYRSSPGRLASRAELSSGAMTNRLDRLEEAALVRRLPDPEDRRRHMVSLTAEGKRQLVRLRAIGKRLEEAFLAPLDEKERAKLHDTLLKVASTYDCRFERKS